MRGKRHQLEFLPATVGGADDIDGFARRPLVAFEKAGGTVLKRPV